MLLCVTLWPRPGREADLIAYEDAVLDLLVDHGARVVQRLRTVERADGPLEVQVLDVPSEEALAAYMDDPRRLALAPARDAAVARTEILRVTAV